MARRKGFPETADSGSTTYSIRLNDAERAVLSKALDAKGWTATRFIRQATLEKAAQVWNTTQFTQFDFEGLARRLAKQLCSPEIQFFDDNSPGSAPCSLEQLRSDVDGMRTIYPETDPAPMRRSDVETLRRAVSLGGTQFLRLILEECDRLVKPAMELPSPIDPAEFV